MLELRTGQSLLEVKPELGGALGRWTRDGLEIFHPVSDPNLIAQHLGTAGAYPLIPFSNRVGYGKFAFGGESFQLLPNFRGEPHTIHGNAWERVWSVTAQEEARVTLTLDHNPPADPAGQWPFRYHAEIDYALRDDGLMVTMRVHNTDTREQPVGLGFHPFYPRDADVELGFSAEGVWQAGPDALPAERLPVDGHWRFEPMRPVDGPALDNCYAGWSGSAFLRWPRRGLALSIAATEPFRHLVVFTPPGRDYLAVEPASNMTDAINHPELPDRGLVTLKPGGTIEGQIEFSISRL